MLKFALILPALVLAALGAEDLYNANRESQADFVIAGLELVAAIALIGLAFVLGRRTTPDAETPADDSADRAEVIERLQRHTESLRLAEEREGTAPPGKDVDEKAPSSSAVAKRTLPSEPGRVPAVEETPSAPVPAATREEAGAVRLPSLMLLNMPASATAAEIESAPPLGTRMDVLARLRDVVPDLEVDARGRSEHSGPDHVIRLDLGAHDPVHTLVIEAAGQTGVSLVRWILEGTGWRAFGPRIGRFVDPDDLDSVAVRGQS